VPKGSLVAQAEARMCSKARAIYKGMRSKLPTRIDDTKTGTVVEHTRDTR
jgi:hypothetical protein